MDNPINAAEGILQAEDDAAAAVAVAPRVTKHGIESQIAGVNYMRLSDAAEALGQPVSTAMECTTLCLITMSNGFLVIGKSACVSPENYNRELGCEIAYKDAFDQIWALEGYLLRERLSGVSR